jgi:hypothetical protein
VELAIDSLRWQARIHEQRSARKHRTGARMFSLSMSTAYAQPFTYGIRGVRRDSARRAAT